jgi:hypothetical protein
VISEAVADEDFVSIACGSPFGMSFGAIVGVIEQLDLAGVSGHGKSVFVPRPPRSAPGFAGPHVPHRGPDVAGERPKVDGVSWPAAALFPWIAGPRSQGSQRICRCRR